ncbi:Asp23/Gls24 family envelope stress response protein [Nonomuraea sp. MG754425]|uniref:Asp23/Gls24 family envelope stress response protein n=1 Tax=Nonomuraea sp. MG754425 TaxID=2570319 RepID=UPI001F15A899|nr:Asp23/Gls24 family envelope stress response protein [Nonomuraea sp. MG754425]MCF6472408.1 Asp23/Gls24 family envelope stress response protein [Nonomuraea sp. MG754425]
MTTLVPAQRPVPLPSPERRGRTEIADRVVAKIACLAAGEVPEVRGVEPRGLPWAPSASEVHGGRATVRLNVRVAYPAPLPAVAARLREHVIHRLETQTGLDVTRVDITVTDVGGARS